MAGPRSPECFFVAPSFGDGAAFCATGRGEGYQNVGPGEHTRAFRCNQRCMFQWAGHRRKDDQRCKLQVFFPCALSSAVTHNLSFCYSLKACSDRVAPTLETEASLPYVPFCTFKKTLPQKQNGQASTPLSHLEGARCLPPRGHFSTDSKKTFGGGGCRVKDMVIACKKPERERQRAKVKEPQYMLQPALMLVR